MKLKEYLQHLNMMAKAHPEVLDYQIVTSSDDEGNYFNPVVYNAGIGLYEDGDFTLATEKEDERKNAICLN